MKYIITSDGIFEQGIIFSEGISHNDIYKYSGQIKSAGFCDLVISSEYDIVIQCYGESQSLGLKSRGREDEKILMGVLDNDE